MFCKCKICRLFVEKIYNMDDKNLLLTEDNLFHDIQALVLRARQHAFRAVDSERVLSYWQVGQRIRTDILLSQRAEFGKKVIKNLGERLSAVFGNSFNHYNLWLFVRFAADFADRQRGCIISRFLKNRADIYFNT